jgi:hypothetical protein
MAAARGSSGNPHHFPRASPDGVLGAVLDPRGSVRRLYGSADLSLGQGSEDLRGREEGPAHEPRRVVLFAAAPFSLSCPGVVVHGAVAPDPIGVGVGGTRIQVGRSGVRRLEPPGDPDGAAERGRGSVARVLDSGLEDGHDLRSEPDRGV